MKIIINKHHCNIIAVELFHILSLCVCVCVRLYTEYIKRKNNTHASSASIILEYHNN
jgi:hypothetical protein